MTRDEFDKLPPHVRRMTQESVEVAARLQALNAFIYSERFGDVDPDEQVRMVTQAGAMGAYVYVLGDRLKAAGVQ